MFIKTKKLTSTAMNELKAYSQSFRFNPKNPALCLGSSQPTVHMYEIISLIFEAFAKILTERVAWGNLMHISIVLKPAGHYFVQ